VSTQAAEADAVVAQAQEHQASQAALTAATVAAVLALWAQMDPTDWYGSWWTRGIGERIYVLLSMAQESVASEAHQFVSTSLDLIGVPGDIPVIVPHAFAGIASDGRDLETLLAGAPIQALAKVRQGAPAVVASASSRAWLQMVIETQIPDAGRAADQVAIATAVPVQRTRQRKRARYGWVRMLNPPSCARCVVLAGKFYRWNEGFLRHPMCDCRHIPAIEAIDDDLTTNPYAYFKSLSKENQDAWFGNANAEAIRNGADISQVVNATSRGGVFTADGGKHYTGEGTTRRGFYGRNAAGVLRPTPWQIFRDAHGNSDEARRELLKFGYITQ
jgi:hypothetical protein